MNVALRQPMSLAEFLEWEERQPTKFEFDGFQPVAMVGVTLGHSAIQRNLLVALTTRLRGQPCQPHGSDVKISVAGRIRYPDALVLCMPLQPETTIVSEPVVVFEILSESSRHTDLVLKNLEYRETSSIQHYVVLEQTCAEGVVFNRVGEEWLAEPLDGKNGILRLPAIGVELSLAELYDDVPVASDGTAQGH